MGDKVTIGDIARISNVSMSTVSLVLNNKPGVSDETRARVLKAAEDLNYPVRSAAELDKCGTLRTIGMIVKTDPDLSPQANPFYSKVMMGIEDTCRRSGIDLLFATLPVDENNCAVEVPQLLSNPNVDGLLMVGTFVDETFNELIAKYKTTIVLVDGYSNTESYSTVVSDNFHAAYQAVEYLIGLGHRHIGLVGGVKDGYPSLKERRNGYLRALKDHEVADTYVANFNINKSHGAQETIALLKEYPQITALFCVNDDAGSTAIRAVQSMGKQIPADISIVGYDDTYLATNAHPALTTVHVDTVAMGRAAVRLLALCIENPGAARMTLTIHTRLIERESAGPVPQKTQL
ncbi:MAG TPA: LacI family DNA-binding transcriptional regulator [Anaerolineales bacterium]|nr:LacI family DNA-binding transcriptional regulator [Anaerolineales bacterium]